jgi:hypothetical protein
VSTPTPGVAPAPYPSAIAPVASPAPQTPATPGAAPPGGATGPADIEAIRQQNLDIQAILAELQAGTITPEVAASQIAARYQAPPGSTTAAPFQPPVIPDEPTTVTVDPTVALGQDAYEKIWGVTPPKGYIESLVKQGLNVFQIELHELSQPGANRTQYWRDNEAAVAAQISQLMGRR